MVRGLETGVVEMERDERGVERREDGREERGEPCRLVGRETVGVGGLEGDSPRRPNMPGSRWPKGRIALNICVTIVAPVAMAASASGREASECPNEKTMPRDVMAGIRSVILPNSGAAVILRM